MYNFSFWCSSGCFAKSGDQERRRGGFQSVTVATDGSDTQVLAAVARRAPSRRFSTEARRCLLGDGQVVAVERSCLALAFLTQSCWHRLLLLLPLLSAAAK